MPKNRANKMGPNQAAPSRRRDKFMLPTSYAPADTREQMDQDMAAQREEYARNQVKDVRIRANDPMHDDYDLYGELEGGPVASYRPSRRLSRLRERANERESARPRVDRRIDRRIGAQEALLGEGEVNRRAYDAFRSGALTGRRSTGRLDDPRLESYREHLQAMGIQPEYAPDDPRAYELLRRGGYAVEGEDPRVTRQRISESLAGQNRRGRNRRK